MEAVAQLVPSLCCKGLEEDPQCPPQSVLVLHDGVVPEEDQLGQDTPTHHTTTQQQLGKTLPHRATQEGTLTGETQRSCTERGGGQSRGKKEREGNTSKWLCYAALWMYVVKLTILTCIHVLTLTVLHP